MALIIHFKELAKSLRSEVFLAYSRLKLLSMSAPSEKLEIGSGPMRKRGWTTLDMCRGADVYWDLRRALPFQDGTFEHVYCSHVLEHFSYPDLRKLLLEVFRVLRPGGMFFIAVPNAALYIDSYLGNHEPSDLTRFAPAVISNRPMDTLNYIFYMDNQHRFMFDEDNLIYHCKEAGFEACSRRAFDSGMDSTARDYESLYMVCNRPAP